MSGDPKDGANCHEVEVTAVDDTKGEITILRPESSDASTLDKNGRPFHYTEVEVGGLKVDEFVRVKALEKEGDGFATVLEFDTEFAKDAKNSDLEGDCRPNDLVTV